MNTVRRAVCFCSIPNSFQWWNSFEAKCPMRKTVTTLALEFHFPPQLSDILVKRVELRFPLHTCISHTPSICSCLYFNAVLGRKFHKRRSTHTLNRHQTTWNCDYHINPFIRVLMQLTKADNLLQYIQQARADRWPITWTSGRKRKSKNTPPHHIRPVAQISPDRSHYSCYSKTDTANVFNSSASGRQDPLGPRGACWVTECRAQRGTGAHSGFCIPEMMMSHCGPHGRF